MARVGQYREQVKLLFAGTIVASDGRGGGNRTGEGPEVPVWARIMQLKGSQLIALGKEINSEVFKISIRYRADADGANRISWKSQEMKIISLTADERRTEITIYAINAQ